MPFLSFTGLSPSLWAKESSDLKFSLILSLHSLIRLSRRKDSFIYILSIYVMRPKIHLNQTLAASSCPSAWQHFRQFSSMDGSDARLKGFNSSHELHSKLTENPRSLHCSGVSSDTVKWMRAKKSERKGEKQLVKSIMPSMQKFAQDKFGSLPGSFIFQIPRRLETRSVLLIEEGKLTEEDS